MARLRNSGLLVVAACALLPAGCGGGGGATYTASATKQCLSKIAGATIDMDGWDYISKSARGGSYRVNIGGDSVVLAFNGTSSDAGRMLGTYKIFASGAGAPVDDILFSKGNVVLAWDSTPTSDERDAVEGCLSS